MESLHSDWKAGCRAGSCSPGTAVLGIILGQWRLPELSESCVTPTIPPICSELTVDIMPGASTQTVIRDKTTVQPLLRTTEASGHRTKL